MIPRKAIRLFAIASFLILGLELYAVVFFTSNTANILAWGILESTSEIAEDLGTLLVYEAVHTSPAFAALALGCWLAMLLPLIRVCQSRRPVERLPQFYGTLAVVLVGFVGVGLLCNLRLMRFPGDQWSGYWAAKMFENPPHPIPSPFFWLVASALPMMVVASCWLWQEIRWFAVIGSVLALPLLVFPCLLQRYLAYHLLCYSDPEVYTTTWRNLSPCLVVVPIVVVYFAGRRGTTS